MLYNGSEVIRDLEWVIFDEVHYINDAEVRNLSVSVISVIYCGNMCIATSPFVTIVCYSLERGCVGGSFDYASRSRRYHSPECHSAKCSGV